MGEVGRLFFWSFWGVLREREFEVDYFGVGGIRSWWVVVLSGIIS